MAKKRRPETPIEREQREFWESDEGKAVVEQLVREQLERARNWAEQNPEDAERFWRGLQGFAQGIARIAVQGARTVQALADRVATWAADHPTEWGKIQAFLYEVHAREAERDDRLRRYAQIAIGCGWPPTKRIGSEAISAVVELADNGATDDELISLIRESWFATFDDDGLAQLAQQWWTWGEVMEPRRVAIEQAFEAHRATLYGPATVAIVAQIEGVVMDAFRHEGEGPWKHFKEYVRRLVDGRVTKTTDADGLAAFITEVLLKDFHRGSEVPELSRHALLHGADTRTPTKERSLKAIIALDAVVGMLGWIAPGDGRFHRPGCAQLRKFQLERKTKIPGPTPDVFYDEELAERKGLRACPECCGVEIL